MIGSCTSTMNRPTDSWPSSSLSLRTHVRMSIADWTHLNDLTVDELQALVLTKNARIDHLVIFGRAEAPRRQLNRHPARLVRHNSASGGGPISWCWPRTWLALHEQTLRVSGQRKEF